MDLAGQDVFQGIFNVILACAATVILVFNMELLSGEGGYSKADMEECIETLARWLNNLALQMKVQPI